MATFNRATKTAELKGGYVCSKCNSVVLIDFILFAHGTTRFTKKKAEEGANAAFERGIKAAFDLPENPLLLTEFWENEAYSLVHGFCFNDIIRPCPFCGSLERWQNKDMGIGHARDPRTGFCKMPEIPVLNRLNVFPDDNLRKSWMEQAVKKAVLLNLELREKMDPVQAEQAKLQILELRKQIEFLQAQKASALDYSTLLHEKKLKKEEEMKNYSFFSAERRRAYAEYRDLSKRFEEERESGLLKEKRFTHEIDRLIPQLRKLQVDNPGVLDELQELSSKTTPYHGAVRYC